MYVKCFLDMQNKWQYGLKGVNQWININIIGSMYVNLSGYDNLRETLNWNTTENFKGKIKEKQTILIIK